MKSELPAMDLKDFHFEIDPRKIREYLLNLDHPKGKSKARWFFSKGFDFDSLMEALKLHGRSGTVLRQENNLFGIFMVLQGPLVFNNLGMGEFRTIWSLQPENKKCRFVTGYPI